MSKRAYFEKLGINPFSGDQHDREKILEAYRRSHEIRQFEIGLYWTRSAYLWTLQAAALAGLALVAERSVFWSCDNLPAENCQAGRLSLVIIVAIWSFGLVSAYVWLLLLRGSKHWQNNWERHVDLLEDYVSGSIYKTYAVLSTEPPYSVSKLNELMARFMVLLWMLIGAVCGSMIFDALPWFVIPIVVCGGCGILARSLDGLVRMSDPGQFTESGEPSGGKYGVRRRKCPDFVEG